MNKEMLMELEVEREEELYSDDDWCHQQFVSNEWEYEYVPFPFPWKYLPQTRQAYTLHIDNEIEHTFSKSKSNIDDEYK